MTDVLILGGTGWLSGRIAEQWLDAGASVTCLARGRRAVPYGARAVTGDRDRPDAYDAVRGHAWDEVVDVSSRADQVAAAVAALDSSRHFSYISSVSVYADSSTRGADESAAVVSPAAPGDEYDYAGEKAAAELAVRGGFGHRAAIIRPGLIAGPGDLTDRFGYWVSRFALAADGPVLVPDAQGARVQVIDVDDLAAFAVVAGRQAFTGTVDAVGDSLSLSEVLASAREVAGHTGIQVTAAPDWLIGQAVAHWAGPRSLPLWLPPDVPGFATRAGHVYRLLGGTLRPLRATLQRVLADEHRRGLNRPRAAGLSRDEELALIAAWER